MHQFWFRFIFPLLQLVAPRRIMEVGAEFGWNTRRILEYCRATGARLDIIDPVTHPDLAAVLAPDRYRVASLPVPRTAETMVSDNGSMIAQGGVAMAYGAFADVARDSQGGETLTAARDRPIDTWFLTKAKAK